MNKTDLIGAIASSAELTKVQAEKAVNAYHETVRNSIQNGDSVSIVGFGTFTVTERKAKTGRNPRTGAVLTIKAAKIPKFKPGKSLKDSVQ
jgi:DNA-binding protein HU-beta